jgi:hypothetical protein
MHPGGQAAPQLTDRSPARTGLTSENAQPSVLGVKVASSGLARAGQRTSQLLGSLSPCALGGHPEAERREHLHVDERMLYRLQVVLCQHPGEIGTADLK